MTAEELLAQADTAAENAYAPYSEYQVGAAVLARDGRVFAAANVENAAYPLGICAELEADMERHVATYECEWKATIDSEERVARFRTFVNSDQPDSNVVFIRERGQPRPARPDEREHALSTSGGK